MVAPNHYDCEGCAAWDEVNGCWNDCRAYCGKNCISGTEEGPTQDYEEEGGSD